MILIAQQIDPSIANFRGLSFDKKAYRDKYYAENREQFSQKRKKWRQENPEKQAEIGRCARLKRKFGMTIEEYDLLLKQQKGVCAICEQPCRTGNRLAVDHHHKTGEIRGLLCYSCNVRVGFIDKYEDRLRTYGVV